MESNQSKNLIIQTAFIGDLLLSIPLIRHVRQLDPARPLALICRKPLGDFFLNAKLVDQVFEVDKSDSRSKSELRQKLRGFQCHWLISPHESFSSARVVRSISANQKIGFHKWWNFVFFNHREKRPLQLPEAIRQLYLLRHLDPKLDEHLKLFAKSWSQQIELDKKLQSQASFAEPEQFPAWAELRLELFSHSNWAQAPQNVQRLVEQKQLFTKPTIFLAPASVWKTKMWRLEGFAEVGREYMNRGYQVAIIGAQSEISICEQLANLIPGAIQLTGTCTLFETAWLLSRGEILFCNDSGAMHLGAVAGIQIVAIFGPTTLELGYRPWSKSAWVVQNPLECRPCGRHGADKCPLGTHACMKQLSAKDVLDVSK